VLGIEEAEHEETAPLGSKLLISKLSCSLVGQKGRVKLMPGSLAHAIYGRGEAELEEQFYCNYGLNPAYQAEIERGEMKVVGTGPDGEARVIELPDHRFFIGTLFVPQLSSSAEKPHELIVAYLKAARTFQLAKRTWHKDSLS
jgi:CTP synthase (UTP-ammonia lyase)